MKATSAFASVLLVAATTSSTVMAEDVRVTFTGTVASLVPSGVAPAPFEAAQIGEVVTIVADAEVTQQLPQGRYLYSLNVPTTTVTVGSTTERLAQSLAAQIGFQDNNFQLGDYVGVSGEMASAPATQLQLLVYDETGGTWASNDIRAMIGTTLNPNGLGINAFFYAPGSQMRFDLQSVSFEAAPGGQLGTPYCTAEPNSTGAIGETSAFGLDTAGDNDLTLIATGLPNSVFGYFVASQTQGFTPGAGGGSGSLCLGGAIGRFVGPGQVKSADFGGEIAVAIDLTTMPTPTASIPAQSGQTWFVQLWHRDMSPAGPTSNFTRGLALTFQ